MPNGPKFSVITSFLGKTNDRFCSYQKDRTIQEKLKIAGQLEGVSAIEIVYPYETPDPKILNVLCSENNLEISAINCNIKADKSFLSGALCSVNKTVRRKAIDLIKSAKDYAALAGSNKVHVAPLNDGFDYLFQENYPAAWKYLLEAFAEVCEYKPEISLFIEYKASEPRVQCFIDSAAKALLICKEIGRPNIGITLDFGHALQHGENPANELCTIAENGVPYYIHINDNNGKWDWDLITASSNYLNYVEFIFWLKEYGYDDFLSSDTSPARLNAIKVFEANVMITSKIWSMIDNLDRKSIKKYMSSGSYEKTLNIIIKDIYRL
ncbi:MAG: sugar phosphate isomerase/epimerase family protein [Candidatus Humimicrobiaceae bacterium]